jgi:hypothetical protein
MFGRQDTHYSQVLVDLIHAERERMLYREALERISLGRNEPTMVASAAILAGSRISDERWDAVVKAADLSNGAKHRGPGVSSGPSVEVSHESPSTDRAHVSKKEKGEI